MHFDKILCQTFDYSDHRLTTNHWRYLHNAILKNHIMVQTVESTVYDDKDSVIEKVKYVCDFDSNGLRRETDFDNKGKIELIDEYVYNLDSNPIKNKGHTQKIYCIKADTTDLINIKMLKRFHIDSIRVIYGNTEMSYGISHNKLVLVWRVLSDSFGNNLKIEEFSLEKKDPSVIQYEYNYPMKNFESFKIKDNEKYLVSIGTLNHNNIVDKENYYWVKYNSIATGNLNNINPQQTFLYDLDENNLLKERTHLFVTDKLGKAISKFTYEYYK